VKLVILGSGTSVPHARRATSAYWLETTRGNLLLDAGPDTAHRMAEEELDWPLLNSIWISHFHLDHVGGLAPFLFGLRWAPEVRERTAPLRIFGPTGLRRLLEAFDRANNYRLFEQRFPVEIVETSIDKFEILPGVSAETFSTPHTAESLSLRLTDGDHRSFVYTSDTGYCDELALFSREADLLLLESSYFNTKSVEKHLHLAQAMKVVELAQPKQVLLTHLYPEWDSVDLVNEANKFWPGKVIEASDGLRIEF
jgi:ribonuclease BN (tRNA processing enzyme)